MIGMSPSWCSVSFSAIMILMTILAIIAIMAEAEVVEKNAYFIKRVTVA